MRTYKDFVEKNFSFLGKGLQIQGSFELDGDVRICCLLSGELTAKKGSRIFIEPEGRIEGQLNCEQIEIMGSFEGDLTCSGKAIFHPSSIINGRVKAKHLVILPGAIVNMHGETLEHPAKSKKSIDNADNQVLPLA